MITTLGGAFAAQGAVLLIAAAVCALLLSPPSSRRAWKRTVLAATVLGILGALFLSIGIWVEVSS